MPAHEEQARAAAGFAVCVCNEDYPVSLELNRVYRMLREETAERWRMVRVVDESGEDCLYPHDFFQEIHPFPGPIPRAPDGAEYRFALCTRNDGYELDLACNTIHAVLPDPLAERDEWLRVIDLRGEDYLYPAAFFRMIDMPGELRDELLRGG